MPPSLAQKSVRPNVISGGQLRKCGDLLEIEIYYNKKHLFLVKVQIYLIGIWQILEILVLMILFVQESLGGWASPSVAIPSMKHYFGIYNSKLNKNTYIKS